MKKLKIKLTFTEGILGTATADPAIYSRFIGSKSPDAATLPEEVAALGIGQWRNSSKGRFQWEEIK